MGKGAGAVAVVENRQFLGVRAESEEVLAGLGPESRAALRQFSFERLIGYGVEFSDAAELRARVLDGQYWKEVAGELASVCRERAEAVPGGPTCAAYLRRASALTRMSQVMMLADTDERRAVYARGRPVRAGRADLRGREHFAVETGAGVLTGWRVDAGPDAVGSAVVVGGVDGWAMDFDAMGAALAERGVEAFLLHAPGQGESRMTNGVYLGNG